VLGLRGEALVVVRGPGTHACCRGGCSRDRGGLPQCQTERAPAGFQMYLLLPEAEPVSSAGGASVIV